ncbi:ACT family 7 protein [Rhizoctonia solani AG-3 Rhs1AP]|uniref:ACT family 7 protein n=2 Tax=Rhizoctonia solani AG-3 TaxID=1086053 RepID=A0A074S7C4_9AGAM|nr:ACT family 7 protein [Rhizoctonia solani AG-3 Rhs1AP]KEP55134.1 ACT family 7 protein [Rhizoctonia solani 123E]
MSFQDSPGSLPDVTITVLDIALRLCTIPRSRLPETTHYVVQQFLRQRPTFLNITLNTSELSIFAEQTTLDDFRPLARRGRLGARSGAPVEISQETWSVLQIDEDKFGDAGTRVCEISAALARAGISILYQSSYMSDFILVKSSSLPSVIALLAHAGFGLYSTDAVALTSSVSPPIIDPPVALEERGMSVRGSLVLDGDVGTHGFGLELMNIDDTFALSSPKRHRSTSNSSFQSITLPPGVYPLASSAISPPSSLSAESSDSEREDEPKQRTGRELSTIPPSVEAVATDLAVIGLSEDASDSWLSRMILLMLYPNMIITPWASPAACKPQDETDLEPETPAELDNHCSPYNEEEQYSASPASPAASHSPASSHAEPTSNVRSPSTRLRSSRRSASPPQPFFSFTRAKGECASVVADVRLLASLFPPADRHMVLSAHELEGVDEIAMTSGDVKAAMRCLTIDLPHGLDAHGLVNHFSSTLHNNGINHLYSSTYKTANLLVDRQDAERAETLLRSC